MRAIVTLLAIIVIVAIVAVWSGFINLSGKSGSLPKVEVAGGALPSVNADVGSIAVGTKNEAVEVPKVSVDTTKKTVSVPTLDVQKPAH